MVAASSATVASRAGYSEFPLTTATAASVFHFVIIMRRAFSLSLLLLTLLWTNANAATDLGGSFELIDQDGRVASAEDFHGKPVLLYFGFASCPDICPLDLARLASVTRSLAAAHDIELTPVFVTIAPARDTPEKLKAYVGYFHKDMVGLTGSDAAIAAMADNYAVYYKRVPVDHSYTMDHSTFMFLLDNKGSYLEHYGSKVPADEVIRRIASRLN